MATKTRSSVLMNWPLSVKLTLKSYRTRHGKHRIICLAINSKKKKKKPKVVEKSDTPIGDVQNREDFPLVSGIYGP